MRRIQGIKLLAETEGSGPTAGKGDRVVYNLKIFLTGGDEVSINQRQAEHLPKEMIRSVDGDLFIDHRTTLGKREAIPAIEYSLEGMKPGGYRKLRVSPHLAYGDKGIPTLIPAGAVLIIELWRRE